MCGCRQCGYTGRPFWGLRHYLLVQQLAGAPARGSAVRPVTHGAGPPPHARHLDVGWCVALRGFKRCSGRQPWQSRRTNEKIKYQTHLHANQRVTAVAVAQRPSPVHALVQEKLWSLLQHIEQGHAARAAAAEAHPSPAGLQHVGNAARPDGCDDAEVRSSADDAGGSVGRQPRLRQSERRLKYVAGVAAGAGAAARGDGRRVDRQDLGHTAHACTAQRGAHRRRAVAAADGRQAQQREGPHRRVVAARRAAAQRAAEHGSDCAGAAGPAAPKQARPGHETAARRRRRPPRHHRRCRAPPLAPPQPPPPATRQRAAPAQTALHCRRRPQASSPARPPRPLATTEAGGGAGPPTCPQLPAECVRGSRRLGSGRLAAPAPRRAEALAAPPRACSPTAPVQEGAAKGRGT
eukprot:162008-Chlamydomonas_euryale.AAC.4